jgi:store-operated calcium entry regulator
MSISISVILRLIVCLTFVPGFKPNQIILSLSLALCMIYLTSPHLTSPHLTSPHLTSPHLTCLVKRYREKPRREWMVWFRDASKQAVSALVAHGWNVLFAVILNNDSHSTDQCTFYFMNFVVDNFIGIPLNVLFLKLSSLIGKRLGTNKLESGNYGDPPRNSIWALQLGVWILIITLVKFILLLAFIMPLRDQLYYIGEHTLGKTEGHPKLELVVVMVLVPLAFNIFGFWVQDSFLKRNAATASGVKHDGVIGSDDGHGGVRRLRAPSAMDSDINSDEEQEYLRGLIQHGPDDGDILQYHTLEDRRTTASSVDANAAGQPTVMFSPTGRIVALEEMDDFANSQNAFYPKSIPTRVVL